MSTVEPSLPESAVPESVARPSGRLSRLLVAVLIGLGVGLTAFGLDSLLVRAFSPVDDGLGGSPWPYLAVGSALAVVLAGLSRWLEGLRRPIALAGMTLVALYALGLLDRVAAVLSYRLDWPKAYAWAELALSLILVAVAFALSIGILQRLAGSMAAAGWLAGLAVAVAVAANRHLLPSFFAPRALLFNAALALLVVAAALGGRRLRWRPPVVLGLAASLVGLLIASLAASSLRPSTIPALAAAEVDGPNLLLLVVDTLRQDVFRSVLDETPEGAAFQQAMGAAVYFDQAVAVAPWTGPSMASVMTGLFPNDHGLVGHDTKSWGYRRLGKGLRTLAVELSENGYWCEALVANIMMRPSTEMNRGFDRYRVASGESVRLPLPAGLSRLGLSRHEYYAPAAQLRRGFSARLRDLETAERPFFFWFHLMDPHQPLHDHGELSPDSSEPDGDELDRLYRQEVRYALAEAARVLDGLDESSVGRDTHVVFLSDHGEMMPSDRPWDPDLKVRHGHGQDLYDPLVHVPLAIRPAPSSGVAVDGPRRDGAVVSHVDLYPTILDMLGIEARRPHPQQTGRSIWPSVQGTAPSIDEGRAVAWSGTYHQGRDLFSVRTTRYKLISGLDEEPKLFDLELDAAERRDVAQTEQGTAADLAAELERLRAAHPPIPTLSDEVPLTDEDLEQLRALGYVGNP